MLSCLAYIFCLSVVVPSSLAEVCMARTCLLHNTLPGLEFFSAGPHEMLLIVPSLPAARSDVLLLRKLQAVTGLH